jgi:hypothetical protein
LNPIFWLHPRFESHPSGMSFLHTSGRYQCCGASLSLRCSSTNLKLIRHAGRPRHTSSRPALLAPHLYQGCTTHNVPMSGNDSYMRFKWFYLRRWRTYFPRTSGLYQCCVDNDFLVLFLRRSTVMLTLVPRPTHLTLSDKLTTHQLTTHRPWQRTILFSFILLFVSTVYCFWSYPCNSTVVFVVVVVAAVAVAVAVVFKVVNPFQSR